MFARTERLTLRPGWPEDAPELVRAIAHEAVVTRLSKAPWPYTLGDALDFLKRVHVPGEKAMLIYAHHPDAVRLVGGIGIHRDDEGNHELGYWLTPGAWGRGYATEAARAVIANARYTLRLRKLTAGHFTDNPASGRVLRKLGFRPTGKIAPTFCRARGEAVPTAKFELDLAGEDSCDDPARGKMAA
ncbi:MAG TPA: GNAT family N-acetyltransferase [Sphingomonas sp.]|nr:GNAT family N-acetyltransferase [Sphingomonas sp.]